MKVGLFFGSFNPVHIGHLIIANYMVTFTDLDELWFIVSPHNPLKDKDSLLDDSLRLEMLNIAVRQNPIIKVSDVELGLSKPSFTIHTLNYLKSKHPENEFVLIMGSDGLKLFSSWKDHRILEDNYERYVYPRPGTEESDLVSCKNCKLLPAPLIDISSTFIRKALKDGKDMRFFLPEGVFNFIKSRSLYQ